MLVHSIVRLIEKKLNGRVTRTLNASRGVMMKVRPVRSSVSTSSLNNPPSEENRRLVYPEAKERRRNGKNIEQYDHVNDRNDKYNSISNNNNSSRQNIASNRRYATTISNNNSRSNNDSMKYDSNERNRNRVYNEHVVNGYTPRASRSNSNSSSNRQKYDSAYRNSKNANSNNRYKNNNNNNNETHYDDADVVYPGEETLFDGESDTENMLDDDNDNESEEDVVTTVRSSEPTRNRTYTHNKYNNNNNNNVSSNKQQQHQQQQQEENRHESRNVITNFDSLLRGKRRSMLSNLHKNHIVNSENVNNLHTSSNHRRLLEEESALHHSNNNNNNNDNDKFSTNSTSHNINKRERNAENSVIDDNDTDIINIVDANNETLEVQHSRQRNTNAYSDTEEDMNDTSNNNDNIALEEEEELDEESNNNNSSNSLENDNRNINSRRSMQSSLLHSNTNREHAKIATRFLNREHEEEENRVGHTFIGNHETNSTRASIPLGIQTHEQTHSSPLVASSNYRTTVSVSANTTNDNQHANILLENTSNNNEPNTNNNTNNNNNSSNSSNSDEQAKLQETNALPQENQEQEEGQQQQDDEEEEKEDVANSEKAEKSAEAYRFLLSHIDAEIAALQRRQQIVVQRRHKDEEKMTHKAKELFEFMESPWLLIPSEIAPPLPATGVDVYIKEQQLKRMKAHIEHHNNNNNNNNENNNSNDNNSNSNNSNETTWNTSNSNTHSPVALSSITPHKTHLSDANDKMFVLACHKNYRNLPWSTKKVYEEAAHYNATLRQELRYRLSTGCSRFETFCESIREATVELITQHALPPLPSMHHSNRSWMAVNKHSSNQHQGYSNQQHLQHRSTTSSNNSSNNSSSTNNKRSNKGNANKNDTIDFSNDVEAEVEEAKSDEEEDEEEEGGNIDDVEEEQEDKTGSNSNDQEEEEEDDESAVIGDVIDLDRTGNGSSRNAANKRFNYNKRRSNKLSSNKQIDNAAFVDNTTIANHTITKPGSKPTRSQQRALETATVAYQSMLLSKRRQTVPHTNSQTKADAGKRNTRNKAVPVQKANKPTRVSKRQQNDKKGVSETITATSIKGGAHKPERTRTNISSSSSSSPLQYAKVASTTHNHNNKSKQANYNNTRSKGNTSRYGKQNSNVNKTEHRTKSSSGKSISNQPAHRNINATHRNVNSVESKHAKNVTGRSASIPLPKFELVAKQRTGKGAASSASSSPLYSSKLVSHKSTPRQSKANTIKTKQYAKAASAKARKVSTSHSKSKKK